MIAKSHRWHKTALAAAVVALLGLSGSNALALSLGRITVQSALGEPLRAEIDVPDISTEEASTLRVGVAPAQSFVSAGLEYNAALTSVQTTLLRRADGRAYIKVVTERPINDPFVDLILEAKWASGRIVRDYTMLFDPPSTRQAAATPTLPIAAPAIPPAAPLPAPVADVVQAPAVRVAEKTAPSPAPTPAPKPAVAPAAKVAATVPPAAAAKPAKATDTERAGTLTVKPGDNASKIAARTKSAGVSLDQMLVAMLRSNPDAFIHSNLNRLQSGAVLNLPTSEQAQALSTKEAAQIVIAQSKDFNDFRQNLATNAPVAAVASADRKASGTVGAKVEDKKPASNTPDKLTLSKGSVQSKVDDAAIAKERAEKEAASRAAEIAKNIADLNKLNAAAKPVASEPAAPAVPIAAVPAPVASAPVPKPSAPGALASEVQETSLLDTLLEDPLVPLAGGGLLALLAGWGLYKVRQRKKGSAQVDSSFLESRLQPDSFFGASGGQRIDTTATSATTNSSMVYSSSQLDAADDVDPVAEADVYLAYGRDVQAEEILKEATRVTPARLAIYLKLLEIYSKRRDSQSFEATAHQALKITGSDAADWHHICEMGLAIDPTNPLYQPGGNASIATPGLGAASTEPAFSESKSVDLDLDLDFSTDEPPAAAMRDVTGADLSPQMDPHPSDDGTALDFDVSDPVPLSVEPDMGLDFEPTNNMPTEPVSPTAPAALSEAAPAADKDSGMLEFDLGSLSLDLDPPVEKAAEVSADEPAEDAPPSTMTEDPLETKLALAEEFVSIGDEDGARALIEEVISEATGDVRAKAQKALAALS